MKLIMAAEQVRLGRGSHGFLGEVPVTELITGNALASAIGLTAGIAQHSNEPWLHFELDGKTLYVAKKPYRYNLNWDLINQVGAVFGTKTVTINGETYKVRLLKGSATNPYVGAAGHDPVGAYGSEWNRLFYPLVPNPTSRPASGVSGEGIVYGAWADYTEAELVITTGNGRYQWCQEAQGANRVLRGHSGVSGLNLSAAAKANVNLGWRPVLELVE